MEYGAARMWGLLVGLGGVEVLSVDGEAGGPLRVRVGCRAARPACGGCGGPLGCVWRAVSSAVLRWGRALLVAETERICDATALGLDETLFWRRGRFRAETWGAGIVDVGRGRRLDVV